MGCRFFRSLTVAVVAVVAAGWAPAHAASIGSYEILTLGLTDGPHTRGDGYQASSVWQPGPGGPTAGHAQRFTGGLSSRFGSVIDLGTSVWIYDSESRATTRIGFWQGPYTRSDGYQRSELKFLGEAGLATGISVNYSLGGHAAWVYDGPSGVTTRVGLVDAAHTRDDGFQDSTVDRFDESGLVAGQSSRYRPGSIALAYQGESAWVYDSASGDSTRAGLVDAAHTKSDGFQRSSVTALGAGFAAGQSWRYAGDAEAGQSAWVYEVASDTTTRVGLLDAGHTGFAGYQQSAVNLLDDSGHAAGWSARFAFGQIAAGRSAWIYDAASGATTAVGLFDADHVTPGGVRFSEVDLLDDAGLAAGYSLRYQNGLQHGRSAWIYDLASGATARVGFFDAEHVRNDGFQSSSVSRLSDSGFAAGTSLRYRASDGLDLGESAWIYDVASGATTRVGLFDAAHTRSDGFQRSFVTFLEESGLAAGTSVLYTGTSTGQSAWIYDAASQATNRIGFYGADYTDVFGVQFSAVDILNGTLAAGRSSRWAGANFLGAAAWIYDASTGDQYSIRLPEHADSYASYTISFLGDDGLALGSYEVAGVSHAFAWTLGDGVADLGSLVAGGLGAAGWDRLASAIREGGLGQLLGQGQLANGSDLAYALAPLPEPGTLPLLGVGLGALAFARRHARSGRSG